ncbi:MAG TPA: AI-2E family transporter, partial [Clostridia bacterium]|nr:AI-2E family transporter [Clostridia bacterium]
DVLLVFALYFGLDLFLYNLGEPLLYGTSTGLSPLAVLVAAVFWTWLWGPVGLLLATPLTVCVVVLGRHVRPLEFLSVLLSDDPVLSPATRFYQRLLARDLDDAAEIVQQYHRGRSLEEVYDSVVVPALSLAEDDRHVGKLDDARQRFILENTRLLLEDLGERSEGIAAGVESGKPRLTLKEGANLEAMAGLEGSWVICLPARDEADELAALMLAQLLAKRGFAAQVLPSGALAGEAMEVIQRLKPAIACVLSVPPFGYMHTRYLCRRLRGQFPELKILSAILTERDVAELKQRQPPLEVDELATSLKQMVDQLICVLPTRAENSVAPAAVPAATALHT